MSVSIWTGEPSPESMNMANTSFSILMQSVLHTQPRHADGSLYGELDGLPLLTFKERVQIALGVLRATEPDPALEPGLHPIFNDDGTFRRGFLIHRLSELLAVIETAIENNTPLRWG